MTEDLMSLRRMQVMSWGYLAVLTLGAWAFHSAFFAWSVLVGGIISILSFWVSHSDVTRLFGSPISVASVSGIEKVRTIKIGYIAKFWIRIVIIGVALLVLIKCKRVNVFGLILGLSTVVFTVTFTAVSVAWRYFFSGRR